MNETIVSDEDKIWAVVPAAGVGQRMAADRPKQYLYLGERTILDHSLKVLLEHPGIAGVVVAIAPGDPYWPRSAFCDDPRVVRVDGGRQRSESVALGLAWLIPRRAEAAWVLVHDAVRPCLRHADVDALLAARVDAPDGAVLGVQARDTIKQTDASNKILTTLDRSSLWHAQTPQLFPLAALYRALLACREEGVAVTDEASAMEHKGYQPVMVPGDDSNIKVTRASDLLLAAAVLQAQARG